MMKRLLCSVVISLAAVATTQAQTQAGSPVTESLSKGRNALNDLRYKDADSLARRVLALGNLLTKQQQIEAMQLATAAMFPEEGGAQKSDSAIAMIKQLVGLGATGIPRDISWPGLDSLFSFVARASLPGKLLLGSRIPASVLYVNGEPQGVIAGLRVVQLSPNTSNRLSIRAEGCTPWDTTVTVQAADSVRVGFRNPRCTK